MELSAVPITIPDDANVIVGQSHFIKTISDLHETLAGSSPSLRFGAAFCEASGPRLARRSGNDAELVEAAVEAALAIAAGHCFVVYLRDGYPVNVMNALKRVPEVCRIICATANPLEVLVAETGRGRGIVGVVDGEIPLGVESDADAATASTCSGRSATASDRRTRRYVRATCAAASPERTVDLDELPLKVTDLAPRATPTGSVGMRLLR